MTDLGATRSGAWIPVITGAYLIVNGAYHALFDTGPEAFRLLEAAFAILGVVVVVMGLRQLIRSKTT